MAKIGILGGTFDPVHIGHIECALMAREQFSLSKILFLPSGNPPHRFANRVTPALTRAKLAELGIKGIDGLEVSYVEVEKTGYTYTSDTLAEMKAMCPGDELFFIIGVDAAARVKEWKDAEKLKDYCTFILVGRADTHPKVYMNAKEALAAIGASFEVLKKPITPVSSTELRAAFRDGKELRDGLIPQDEARYIIENEIYIDKPMSPEQITEDLRSVLPPKRFVHSLGVSKEAVRLAEKFGADKEKAKLAGLLHDCAKGVTVDQLRWADMRMEDFSDDPAAGFSYRVLHGPLGAKVAKSRYGVTDEEVLSAISKHTTGGRDMSLLDQIIFIADYTEENRSGGFFEKVRDLVETEGLLPAIAFSCDETIKTILSRGEPIDVRTVYTRNMALARAVPDKVISNK